MADAFAQQRLEMVNRQLLGRGIVDPRVLDAFRKVPRHEFVPRDLRAEAYQDHALTIGPEQSISQPYIVGLMLQQLSIGREERVLEIGTGSGYQTALLAELSDQVHTIEIDGKLQQAAKALLTRLGYKNIQYHVGDGHDGWPERKEFDVIVVTAAAAMLPVSLTKQLALGGRMILPLKMEEDGQELILLRKTENGLDSENFGEVRFVEMKKI